MKIKRIGLFGLGCVGHGLWQLIQAIGSEDFEITRVVVKNKNKPRLIPSEFISYDPADILDNPEIDLIVEAIDDADEAWRIISGALRKGIPAITANKKMVARHLGELISLQEQFNTPLLYEASVCGAIPIVRTVESYFSNEPVLSINGIFNGTSNYILSKIFSERIDYSLALRQAQELGFAETDPTADVGGFDPKYKLIILAVHAFGTVLKTEEVLNIGIDPLGARDIEYARSNGWKIKLIPSLTVSGGKVIPFVLPRFVTSTEQLFGIDEENNAVQVEMAYSGNQFFSGKGAGSFPTASAVLADIRTVLDGGSYHYPKRRKPYELADEDQVFVEVYLRYSDELLKKALRFDSISEGFMDDEYQYVIGMVSLGSLRRNTSLISRDGASVIHTGKFRNGSGPAKPRFNKEVLREQNSLIGPRSVQMH